MDKENLESIKQNSDFLCTQNQSSAECEYKNYFDFMQQYHAAKGKKLLQKQLELKWFLSTKGKRFKNDDYDKKIIEKYENETPFERQLHEEAQAIYKVDLPFYIKWVTRKRAAANGCFTIPGNEIALYQARHLYSWGEHKGELDIYKLRSTLIHEYAHYLTEWVSGWDNKEHGEVFEAVHYILLKITKKSGYYLDNKCGKMDIDEDHFHNKMKNNVFYIPVCKRMGVDSFEFCKDEDMIVTDYPDNFNIII